jgi:hypothetical protein
MISGPLMSKVLVRNLGTTYSATFNKSSKALAGFSFAVSSIRLLALSTLSFNIDSNSIRISFVVLSLAPAVHPVGLSL